MLFHQLRQNLVLGLQLRFQRRDPLLLPLTSGIGLALESRRAVLKKHPQPTVEDRAMDLVLVAQSGNRNPFDQVPAENGNLLLRGLMLALVAHGSSPL